MVDFLREWQLSLTDWSLVFLCAALIAMAKTGLSGAGLMVVPILAGVFGGRPSTGILLPMLIMADWFAVSWYNRHASWKHILRLMPWALAGIAAGGLVGGKISENTFTRMIAVMVIAGIGLMLWQDLRGKKMQVPDYPWFAALLGLAGGFASMAGNAAGPVMALYLLSMRLPKNNYIGTAAWFFFIVNLVKVPVHVFYWKTISLHSLVIDLVSIPAILAGAFAGVYLVRLIPEKAYRWFIIASTLVSSAFLFS